MLIYSRILVAKGVFDVETCHFLPPINGPYMLGRVNKTDLYGQIIGMVYMSLPHCRWKWVAIIFGWAILMEKSLISNQKEYLLTVSVWSVLKGRKKNTNFLFFLWIALYTWVWIKTTIYLTVPTRIPLIYKTHMPKRFCTEGRSSAKMAVQGSQNDKTLYGFVSHLKRRVPNWLILRHGWIYHLDIFVPWAMTNF